MPIEFGSPNLPKMVDGKTDLDEKFFNLIHGRVDQRLATLEELRISWESATDTLTRRGLARIDEVLSPAFLKIEDVLELGFMTASSSTSQTLVLNDELVFIVEEGARRELFTPTEFLAITRVATFADYALARRLSYNPTTGALTVKIISVAGNVGPHSDWEISGIAANTVASHGIREEVSIRRDEVVSSAEEVALNKVAASEAATSAADGALTATSASEVAVSSAAAAAADAAIASASAAAAVGAAGVVGNYLSLAAAMAAIDGLDEGAGVSIIDDGANNGLWVKESGALVKKSDATIPGLDAALTNEQLDRQFEDGKTEGSALDAALLRDIALRTAMRDARGDAFGASVDAALLRDIALRTAMRDARGDAFGASLDIAALRREPATKAASTDIEAVDIQWSVDSRYLNIHTGRSALRSAGRAIYVGGSIEIPAPTTGHVDDEAVTLAYAYPAWVLAASGRLAHPNVKNVVVSGASSAWTLGADQGVIVRTSAGADEAVTVDYDWSMARYDLIEADLAGSIYRKPGTERERDVAEFVPQPTPGRVPLLLVRSTAWDIAVIRLVDEERQSLSAPAIIQRARARRMINLHRTLRAGDPVVIAGYGDSRTNLGGAAATPYAPNGQERDTIATSGYLMTQGGDFKSAIPLFDHGDGAGQIHTHVGWNWELLRAIEARYPGAHEYLNFGIGGTTTGDTSNGGTVPARLAGLTGSGATIATIAFGMNELGTSGPDTTANLIAIGEACTAADIDPVFIAPARPNAIYPSGFEGWIIECRQVKAAADYLGVPYIDPVMIYGADRPVALDPRDCCMSNLYNHDSVHELTAMGRLLTRIVLDI